MSKTIFISASEQSKRFLSKLLLQISSKTIKPLLSTFSPYSLCAGVLKSFAIISNNSTTPASFILPFSLGGRIILAILSIAANSLFEKNLPVKTL